MWLRPSDIRYSQDSISNFFSDGCRHSGTQIGETLDDLCEGRCTVRNIPTISVAKHSGEWVTTDNRRLWVFRKLESLGKCSTIPVYVTSHIFPDKLTRTGSGTTIRVRGSDPGGHWYRRCPHSGTLIGETLDDLCEGRCSIRDIPTISVANHNGEWVTTDNRRLWVFRKLESLGKCSTVPVYVTSHIFPDKLTRTGSGTTIRVRGFGPGGHWDTRQFGYDSSIGGRFTSYDHHSPFSSSVKLSNSNTTDPVTVWHYVLLFLVVVVAVIVFIWWLSFKN